MGLAEPGLGARKPSYSRKDGDFFFFKKRASASLTNFFANFSGVRKFTEMIRPITNVRPEEEPSRHQRKSLPRSQRGCRPCGRPAPREAHGRLLGAGTGGGFATGAGGGFATAVHVPLPEDAAARPPGRSEALALVSGRGIAKLCVRTATFISCRSETSRCPAQRRRAAASPHVPGSAPAPLAPSAAPPDPRGCCISSMARQWRAAARRGGGSAVGVTRARPRGLPPPRGAGAGRDAHPCVPRAPRGERAAAHRDPSRRRTGTDTLAVFK